MIRRENINFMASLYAPNPKEVTYWIDLTASSDGQIIKTYVNNEWVKVNEDLNNEQDKDIVQLQEDVATLKETKADKATTYSKTEVDNKLNARVAANVAESSSATVETLETKVNELINALITAGLMAAA